MPTDPVDRIKEAVPDWESYELPEFTDKQMNLMSIQELRAAAEEIHKALSGMSISANKTSGAVRELQHIARQIQKITLEESYGEF